MVLKSGFSWRSSPDHFEVSVGLHLQASTGTDTVEVPVDIELQQIRGIVAWTALSLDRTR